MSPEDAYGARAGDIPAAHQIVQAQLANDIAAANLVDLALSALPSFPAVSEIVEPNSGGGGMADTTLDALPYSPTSEIELEEIPSLGGVMGWLNAIKSLLN